MTHYSAQQAYSTVHDARQLGMRSGEDAMTHCSAIDAVFIVDDALLLAAECRRICFMLVRDIHYAAHKSLDYAKISQHARMRTVNLAHWWKTP